MIPPPVNCDRGKFLLGSASREEGPLGWQYRLQASLQQHPIPTRKRLTQTLVYTSAFLTAGGGTAAGAEAALLAESKLIRRMRTSTVHNSPAARSTALLLLSRPA
jgi:hypothetical protein